MINPPDVNSVAQARVILCVAQGFRTAEMTGIAQRTAQKTLAKLEARGLVDRADRWTRYGRKTRWRPKRHKIWRRELIPAALKRLALARLRGESHAFNILTYYDDLFQEQ